MRRKILACLLALLCLLAGCQKADTDSEGLMLDNELIRIGEESCSLAEAMIFVAAQKNIYQDSYGGDIWSVQLESGTFEDYIMDGLKSYLGKLFSAAQMAKLQGRTLTEAESERVNDAASAYMAAMSENEIAETHLSEEVVRDAYEQYVLALGLYEDVLKAERVEVSEDEARVIHLQRILIHTGDEEAASRAQEAQQELAEGKDFTSVLSLYNEGETSELEVMRGELPEDQEKIAFALGTDEVSELAQVADGYVIFKCLNSYDETASKANQSRLLAERQDEVFSRYLSSFLAEHAAYFNDQAWEKVSISGYTGAASANFYLIYQEYFTEAGD